MYVYLRYILNSNTDYVGDRMACLIRSCDLRYFVSEQTDNPKSQPSRSRKPLYFSAGLFWATEGAVALGYPEPSKRGKYMKYDCQLLFYLNVC